MTQFVKVDIPQRTTLDDFISRAEALVAEARRHGFSVIVGIDQPGENIYLTSNTTLETSDDLFLLIAGLAPRQHPSILTLPHMDEIMQRLEVDAEELRDAGVPFVCGIQPEPHGRLRILSYTPEETRSPILAAHFDLTIDPNMLGDTSEVPCS